MSKKENSKSEEIEFFVPGEGAVMAPSLDDVQGTIKDVDERSAQEDGDGDR